ncbi:unnamed protein product [Caenorhabditis brenneri]
MDTFPLLRLPQVVLREALRTLNPIELFLLSNTSKKTSALVAIATINRVVISLNLSHRFEEIALNKQFRIEVLNEEARGEYPFVRMFRIMDNVFGFYSPGNGNKLRIFLSTGLLSAAYHISESFKCPINRLSSSDRIPSARIRDTLQNLQGIQRIPLKKLKLNSSLFRMQDLEWILKNVKVTEKLSILVETPGGWELPEFPTECEKIVVNPSGWITVFNLLSFKTCSIIELDQSTLSNSEIDHFLRRWQEGDLPKLEYLEIRRRLTLDYFDPIFEFTGPQLKRTRYQERTKR